MSEAKHTDGPWIVPRNGSCGPIICAGNDTNKPGRILFVLRHPTGTSDHISEEELSAAAFMSAASPDLLASLRDMLRILEAVRYTVGLGRKQMQRIEAAHAAISKATGAAP